MKSKRAVKSLRTSTRVLIYSFFSFVCLLPLYWLVKSSITDKARIFNIPPDYIPLKPVFENYIRLFDYMPILNLLKNSLIISLGSSIVSVFVSFLAAYVFARIRFRGSNIIFMILIMTTAFPQILSIIPLFEMLNKLNLVNSYYGIILLITSSIIPFTVWIMVSFIKQIPLEVEEAAIVDGASQFTIIMRKIFPLTLPAIASMVVLNFVTGWNELLYPLIFSTSKLTKPFSVALGEVIHSASTFGRPWDLITSLTVVMIIPPVLMVLFFQKYIISGLTSGSIK